MSLFVPLLLLMNAPPNLLQQSEDAVARSIVRIERQTMYRLGDTPRRVINHGTGVVIATERVNGHPEYLVLSNEHIARNGHVLGTSTLYIIGGRNVSKPIRLEVLAVDRQRDQALLRTVGCEERFVLPDYVIGPPPEDVKLDNAFTAGYGDGIFSIREGGIASTSHTDWGLPCYEIDFSVGAGQSGAPLVVIGADRKLYLPALIFCGDDHHTAATPLFAGKGVLRRLPAPGFDR
jgi:hypothetical protein